MKYSQVTSTKRGFTLIELMVVVGLIMMLSAVVLTSVLQGRDEARDIRRITDVEQIKLALKLYKEARGSYPDYPMGAVIGEGGPIDDDLRPFLSTVNADPLSGREGFQYMYYPTFECNGVVKMVVVALTMEFEKNRNYGELCNVTPYNTVLNFFVKTTFAAAFPTSDIQSNEVTLLYKTDVGYEQ